MLSAPVIVVVVIVVAIAVAFAYVVVIVVVVIVVVVAIVIAVAITIPPPLLPCLFDCCVSAAAADSRHHRIAPTTIMRRHVFLSCLMLMPHSADTRRHVG